MTTSVVITLCIVSAVFGAIVWDFVIDCWHRRGKPNWQEHVPVIEGHQVVEVIRRAGGGRAVRGYR